VRGRAAPTPSQGICRCTRAAKSERFRSSNRAESIHGEKVQQESRPESRKSHEGAEEGYAAKRPLRQARQEPQAGHRDRPVRGSPLRRQGPEGTPPPELAVGVAPLARAPATISREKPLGRLGPFEGAWPLAPPAACRYHRYLSAAIGGACWVLSFT